MLFVRLNKNKCWICGATEDLTGEHKVKKSDLNRQDPNNLGTWQDHFGNAKSLQSLNARILKFPKSICANCNTTLTQPADRAYEAFRKTYDEVLKANLNGSETEPRYSMISLNFSDNPNTARFLAKNIGCQLAYNGFPVPVRLARFVREESSRICIQVTARIAPFQSKDTESGEVYDLSAIGGIALRPADPNTGQPAHYATGYINDGIQFSIRYNLNWFEFFEIRQYYKYSPWPIRVLEDPDEISLLGLPDDKSD